MAEWARLLSECWVKPVAGSNPALPATEKRVPQGARFVIQLRVPAGGMLFESALPATTKTRSGWSMFFSQGPLGNGTLGCSREGERKNREILDRWRR